MRMRGPYLLLVAATLGALAGCSVYEHSERPPWRAEAEQVCLAKGLLRESAAIRASRAMDGPGICGVSHPFRVTALAEGSVTLNATQTLDCPMIAALDRWVREVVQPAAQARFGEPVVRIDSMGSYSCRGINNISGASLSEHAFANAIDIGGFVLASGRVLDIRRGFNSTDEQERAFLHEAHAGACAYFTTVLGPGYNIFHYNHFHMDLAMHGMTSRGPRRYCKPVPQTGLPGPPVKDNLPDPPPLDEEMDIARAPIPAPALRSGPPTLATTVPALATSAPPSVPMRTAIDIPRRAPSAEPTGDGPRDATPAGPKSAAGDVPLISFAEPEPPHPPSIATQPQMPRPGLRGAPASRSSDREMPGPEAAPLPAAPIPRRREPDAVGSPRDWDVTSSLGR